MRFNIDGYDGALIVEGFGKAVMRDSLYLEITESK